MRGSRRHRRKMERRSERNHRSRCHSLHSCVHSLSSQRCEKPGRFMSFLYNVFLFISLVAVVYFMLDYHCDTCDAKGNLRALTKNIEDISYNLVIMKNNYRDLESKMTQYTRELPRIQGQIEMLDALSDTIERNKCHMTHMYPNSDLYSVFKLKCVPATQPGAEQTKSDTQHLCLKTSN